MSALAFYIDAPLQSWGASSKFQFRETNNFPTKSAIVGLIAAALGIDKYGPDEAEGIAPIAALRLTMVKIEKSGSSTRLTDFHTIGGGYPDTALGRMHIPPVAEKTKGGGLKWKSPEKRTVVSYRSYLTDAAFVAILEGDSNTLDQIERALLNPTWGIWFGRKSCLPATPLTPTLGTNSDDALTKLLNFLPTKEPKPLAEFERQEEVRDATNTAEGVFHQSDQPTAFGQHHGPMPAPYHARPIRHHRTSS